MWHIKEEYGRREAFKVAAEKALWLEENKGGKAVKFHTPTHYTGFSGEPLEESNVLGYISNKKPIYNYPQIEVVADGICIAVTRKEDAVRIMHALKRDYKTVIMRYK